MIPVQFGVDIFEELKRLGFNEFFVPEAVIFEIEKLIKRERGSDRAAAKVARSMMDRCERITDAKGQPCSCSEYEYGYEWEYYIFKMQ